MLYFPGKEWANMAKKRFEVIKEVNRVTGQTSIIIDRKTGVNYLWHFEGLGAGLTVLVDQEGKQIVTPVEDL